MEICEDVVARPEGSGRAAVEVLRASCLLAGVRVIDLGRRAAARVHRI